MPCTVDLWPGWADSKLRRADRSPVRLLRADLLERDDLEPDKAD